MLLVHSKNNNKYPPLYYNVLYKYCHTPFLHIDPQENVYNLVE